MLCLLKILVGILFRNLLVYWCLCWWILSGSKYEHRMSIDDDMSFEAFWWGFYSKTRNVQQLALNCKCIL